ncbi:hypothetical protein C4901_15460 [Acidiferrobacter sp. SPIII_3]|nr:hypothetical protein C4901_15460 [Acidiferrobacter sp. SPIII_3]
MGAAHTFSDLLHVHPTIRPKHDRADQAMDIGWKAPRVVILGAIVDLISVTLIVLILVLTLIIQVS